MKDFKGSRQMLAMTVSSLRFPCKSDLTEVCVTSATKINIHNLYFVTHLKDCKKFVTLPHIVAQICKSFWYFLCSYSSEQSMTGHSLCY